MTLIKIYVQRVSSSSNCWHSYLNFLINELNIFSQRETRFVRFFIRLKIVLLYWKSILCVTTSRNKIGTGLMKNYCLSIWRKRRQGWSLCITPNIDTWTSMKKAGIWWVLNFYTNITTRFGIKTTFKIRVEYFWQYEIYIMAIKNWISVLTSPPLTWNNRYTCSIF